MLADVANRVFPLARVRVGFQCVVRMLVLKHGVNDAVSSLIWISGIVDTWMTPHVQLFYSAEEEVY